jgi:hypothetical protein
VSPLLLKGEGTKVKVTVENATIRLKPAADSDVIEEVTIGTILEAEKKVGEFYAVKFRSKVGVLITGYIHEMFVEEVPGETPQPPEIELPKKPTPKEPVKPWAEEEKAAVKGEFMLGFGAGFGSFLNDSCVYAANWKYNALSDAKEQGSVNQKVKSPMGIGASFSYYFAGNLGLRLRLDFNFAQKFRDDSKAYYSINWTWNTGVNGSRNADWPADGELSIMPLSLNFIYKLGKGTFVPFISGGASYFMAKIKADATRGYGLSWVSGTNQYIDYVPLPLRIDKSLNAVGANFGGGVDFSFGRNLALSLEATYFLAKKIEEKWLAVPGTYVGTFYPNSSWIFSQDFVNSLADSLTPLAVNLGFFKALAAVKILF